ncbi:Bro-N domain-containing protein [Epilithonimonas sp.]|uniref:BRO-N domain-containing protein n=1 Tax=Epilithonimonas sp. TaxID=2894511 RepID=UPI0035B0D38B
MEQANLNYSEFSEGKILNDSLQIFQNSEFGEVRIILLEGNPWFCLQDICKSLGLRTSAVRERLNDDVVTTDTIIDNLGRRQLANFVNEDGLYDTVLDSRKPAAKKFRKWLTSEVLPTIRKTGSYSVKPLSQLEIIAQSAQILLEQDQKIKELAHKQESLQEKVEILEAKSTTRPNYFTIVGYATLHKIECGIKLASSLGRKASDYCKRNNIATESIPDPRFGLVKTYPTSVLDVIFNTPLN